MVEDDKTSTEEVEKLLEIEIGPEKIKTLQIVNA